MQIATQQKKEIDSLRGTLKDLEDAVSRDARGAFTDLRKKLDGWAARVAVIGQVKAGKSTFLNSFLGQHDFLPSDVNPWTSVVTNIRINLNNDPETGASFEFFDESSWDEIINGGSDVRKLTEQLLPGFDAEILRRQTEEMKKRAQARLGRHYKSLLGTRHNYDFLTSDLLQSYVCAGPGTDEGLGRDNLGRYASITKVADLYFRRPEFAVPAIITDTPGVNDPFLVRDEFTCRSLDKSDVFIVVLSAHQALTEVDIALMRILAQQETKDVIVFVNRIDELDNFDTHVERVKRDVARRLGDAIPDVEFTIHAGSAYFADLALRDDAEAEAQRHELDDDRLRDYVRATNGKVPASQRDRFMAASGLDDIKRTLSTVIDHGVGSQQIAQLVEDTRTEIGGLLFVNKRERDSVQMQVENINAKNAANAIAALKSEINNLSRTRKSVEASYEAAASKIDDVVANSWSGLERALNQSIGVFIDEQRQRLKEMVFGDAKASRPKPSLNIDMLPLREHLERDVATHFDKARSEIDTILGTCMTECLHTVTRQFELQTDGITLDGLPFNQFVSTLTISKKRLDVGLITGSNWAFWRRKNVDVEKTLDALRMIAAAELRPAIQKILKAFNEAQIERAMAGQARLQVIPRMVESAIDERKVRLKADMHQLQQINSDPETVKRMVHRLHSQLEVLERRILHLSVCDSNLAKNTLARAA